MKADEQQLLTVVREWHGRRDRPFITKIGAAIGIHEKRTGYLLNKWIDKGWLECGVSARTGWLTEKGLEAAGAESK